MQNSLKNKIVNYTTIGQLVRENSKLAVLKRDYNKKGKILIKQLLECKRNWKKEKRENSIKVEMVWR